MKKIATVLIAVVIIALLVLVWILYTQNNKIEQQLLQQNINNPAVDTIALDPYEGLTLEGALNQIPSTYKEDVQFRSCSLSSLESCLGQTINQAILAGASIDACDDFFTETGRDSCRATNTITQARESGDVAVCDDLGDAYKMSCMVEAATAKAEQTQDIDACNVLDETYRTQCINRVAQNLAQQTGDAGWCDKIIGYEGPDGTVENFEKDSCKQQIEFLKEAEAEQQKQEAALNAQQEIVEVPVPVDEVPEVVQPTPEPVAEEN